MKLTAVLNARSGGDVRRIQALRVERQPPLRALHQVDHQEAEQAEAQQRRRVLRPALLHFLPDAGGFVSEHFQPAKRRMQKRAPAFEHRGHIRAQRFSDEDDERK